MKCFLFIAALLIHLSTTAQSPYLSVLLKMELAKSGGTQYKIEMKICEPKKMTVQGDWFTHDTSKIDFASLQADEINCGEYFSKGTPELISGKEEEIAFNQFKYGNQNFAWEKILIFRISNWSSRRHVPDMHVIMPMKYKSFVTAINLTGLEFQSGKVIFLNDYTVSQEGMTLKIDQSLKNYKAVEAKDSPFKN